MKCLALAALCGLVLAACGEPGAALPGQPVAPAGTAPASYLAKVKWKAAAAAESFAIKVKEDGAKLVDAQENELARLRAEPGKVRIKDAAEQPLGAVHVKASQWHLKDAAGKVLFQLVRQDDGDLKLQDGGGSLLFRIKRRDYGAEVETPDDRSLFKAKRKNGGLALRDAEEATVLSSDEAGDPQAAALLVVPGLTLPQRAALWYVLEHPSTAQPR